MATLYAVIDDEIYKDLQGIAKRAGLSVTKTTEAILAIAQGRQHVFANQVEAAVKEPSPKPRPRKGNPS